MLAVQVIDKSGPGKIYFTKWFLLYSRSESIGQFETESLLWHSSWIALGTAFLLAKTVP